MHNEPKNRVLLDTKIIMHTKRIIQILIPNDIHQQHEP